MVDSIVCMQAALLKEYPNKMLVAAVAERDMSKWKLGLDMSLLAVVYIQCVIALTSSPSIIST